MRATVSFSEPKARGYMPPANEEEKLLQRRVADLCRAAQYGQTVRLTGFLSDREQELARAALSGFEGHARFWGGFEGAERQMLALGADREPQEEEFGILCLRVEPQFSDKPLTHRDYLGSLMGLGIKRESVGDIAVLPEGGALVYAKQPAARLIEEELSTVGRSAVRVTKAGPLVPPQPATPPEERTATVPSLRLDAVLAVMLHLGRSAAAQLIKSGAVSVNHIETSSAHYEVFESDVFRVRGYGKYKLCKAGAQSKKGRIIISYCQY